MAQTSKLRVYIATSLDGFIAGPDDDLSWLTGAEPGETPSAPPAPDPESGALSLEDFLAEVGCVLMGRRTFDVVQGFGGEWFYGELPMLIATSREFSCDRPQVQARRGDIQQLVKQALELARGKDVYIDGGNLIRQALDARLVDDVVVTLAPVVLGEGIPLFAGAAQRHQFETLGHYPFPGGMVQWHLRPRR
ncbi:MAG: dihydrofolate reductase family protein [Myxococcales bacterium]|nr:dihydrofolate reductase family protein [Myxococcales bacterium]